MIPYYERLDLDQSGITVEKGDSIQEIRYLQNGNEVPLHQHDFYEILLIRRGTCRHFFKEEWIPLIPGDVIILGRDDAHALRFFEDSAYTNCQFTEDLAAKLSLEDRVREILRTSMQSQSRPYMRRVQESMILWGEEADVPLQEEELVDLNHQGIIHLHPQEMRKAAELMENMLTEQTVRTPEFRRVKELLLEMLIICLKRARDNQMNPAKKAPDWQTQLIHEVMAYIEAHIDQELDFEQISKAHHISMSHFRKLFKEVSGMPPVEYVNRVRILRSLELLQTTRKSIAEIAAAVGIHDQNYYARLFKKMIGCSPSYYKSV